MTEPETKSKKTRKPNVGSDPSKGPLVVRWQVGFYAFAIGASVILLSTTARSIIRGNFSRIALIISLLVTGLSWTFVTAKNKTFKDPGGTEVSKAEPALHDFVHAIAAEIGAPLPREIILVAEAELDLREATRYFGRTIDRSVLVIGLPYLQSLTRQELAALIAHELAHYAETDVEEGVRAVRSLREARQLIATERQGFVNGIYGSYARKMYRSVGGVGIAQEEAADRLAAQAYGSDALLSGLSRLDDVSVAFDQLLRDYVVPALQHGAHPLDMFAGFGELLASPVRSQARSRDVERRIDKERKDFDLHLKPMERVALIETWAVKPGSAIVDDSDSLAITLLDADAKSEEIVVGTWASNLMTDRTEPQTWQELTEQVYSVASHTTASLPFADDAGPAEQFEHALAWAADGDWHVVDEALTADLKKREVLETRRTEWAQCLVAEAAAATDTFNWKHNWDGPPVLTKHDGSVFDSAPIAALLLDGDADGTRAAFASVL